MHKLSDSISAVKGIGPIYGDRLKLIGLSKIKDLTHFNKYWVPKLRNTIPIKVLHSLIECAAIYCENKEAITICKKNLSKYKTFKYYLSHETAFRLLAERKQLDLG